MQLKTYHYILVALFSYLFFMLSGLPANKIISFAEEKNLLPSKFYGVYGSLWNGGAEQVTTPNQITIDNLQWSLNPGSLLFAKLSSEVSGSVKSQKFIGNASINALGEFKAYDVRTRVDAAVMQELIKMPFGELGGVFNLTVDSLSLNETALPDITANIKWQSAKLTIAETVDLGHINISIQPDTSNQLTATLSNTQGQLSISGTASIDDKKIYALNIKITPQSGASSSITQSLAMFSRRQTDGSYLINRRGNLREIGL